MVRYHGAVQLWYSYGAVQLTASARPSVAVHATSTEAGGVPLWWLMQSEDARNAKHETGDQALSAMMELLDDLQSRTLFRCAQPAHHGAHMHRMRTGWHACVVHVRHHMRSDRIRSDLIWVGATPLGLGRGVAHEEHFVEALYGLALSKARRLLDLEFDLSFELLEQLEVESSKLGTV